ncbi:hypothetical protein DGWBC_0225 [Dehalogenimonas sp. WBC-2]|nr:hypothetical protein DGWBC_0225 [Dehalogenimonas sp. WBC-2]
MINENEASEKSADEDKVASPDIESNKQENIDGVTEEQKKEHPEETNPDICDPRLFSPLQEADSAPPAERLAETLSAEEIENETPPSEN